MSKVLITSVLIVSAACSACFVYAETGASCTPNTVSVSNSSPAAGDSVTLYTVTNNTMPLLATHTVSFLVDNASIGSQSVELTPGEPRVVSATWTATPGVHTASARAEIPSTNGTTTQTTSSVTFTVATPPPPSEAKRAASSVASAVQRGAAAAAPTVLGFAHSAFELTEGVRADAIKALENQIAKETDGDVLGASDSNLAAVGSADSFLSNIWDKLLRSALFATRTKLLFYGLLAVVTYIVLRLVMAWFSERRRSSFARG